ncbi:MAG: hypothetical protein Q8M31_02815 [Beijerinckiaceae bacterium]|nr:hypothetical protein [Beijerinckiaceae bacterium]
MTRDDLKAKIQAMAPGQYASIPYDLYSDLFPPGEPDEPARDACYNFAKSLGCRVENKPEMQEVWIVKDANRT